MAKKKTIAMKCGNMKSAHGCVGCAYVLGFLGSAVYYISTAETFGAGVVGALKALVWPAFLVFEVLKFVGA